MSIVDITQAATGTGEVEFDKFDLGKDNLKARIMLPSTNIAQVHIHSLYREEADMVTNDKGYSRPEWERHAFAGTYICTGDFAKVAGSRGYGDPEACAACAAVHNGPKIASAPKRQYAMNVVQYATKSNSFDPTGGATTKLWKHGAESKISPIKTALDVNKGTKITGIDFVIESGSSADDLMYKKWQINFTTPPAYTQDEQLKAAVQAAMAEQYDEETLIAACGEKVTPEALAAAVKDCQSAATAGAVTANDSMFKAETTTVTETPVAVSLGGSTVEADLPKVSVTSIDDLL